MVMDFCLCPASHLHVPRSFGSPQPRSSGNRSLYGREDKIVKRNNERNDKRKTYLVRNFEITKAKSHEYPKEILNRNYK